ncbi:MAG: hypothetical protein N2745_00515, partial [Syntrophorhabdaceae bacterium]|nr:hypothetical protein [Syntrophorhabdaceae bacterium]
MITITLSNLLNSHPFFLYFFNKSFIKRLILFFAIFPVILMQSMAYADGLIYLPQTGQTKCY